MKMKAVLAVLAAGIFWGNTGLFVKTLSACGLETMQLSVIRLSVAALCYSGIMFFKDRSRFRIKLKDLWMFVAVGVICMALFNATYFYTIVNGGASVAVVLLYTAPIFVVLISIPLFQERLNKRTVIAVLLTLLGCVFVTGFAGSVEKLTPAVIVVGVSAGLCYSLYTILGKVAMRTYKGETFTMYAFIFGACASVFMCDAGEAVQILFSSPKTLLLGIGMGLVGAVAPYFLYTYGLRYLESGRAATIAAIEPVVGSVIGMVIFKESHEFAKILGIVMILAAIVIINLGGERAMEADDSHPEGQESISEIKTGKKLPECNKE